MRRPIVLLCLVITSMALAACTDISAPRHDDPNCISGYQTSDGRWVCQ
jgi:hypothetical protein